MDNEHKHLDPIRSSSQLIKEKDTSCIKSDVMLEYWFHKYSKSTQQNPYSISHLLGKKTTL